MAQPITKERLEQMARQMCRALKTPEAPYERQDDGTLRANVGCVIVDAAYGGFRFAQITNEHGGETDLIGSGFSSKVHLYEIGFAWLRGFDAGQRSAA